MCGWEQIAPENEMGKQKQTQTNKTSLAFKQVKQVVASSNQLLKI